MDGKYFLGETLLLHPIPDLLLDIFIFFLFPIMGRGRIFFGTMIIFLGEFLLLTGPGYFIFCFYQIGNLGKFG